MQPILSKKGDEGLCRWDAVSPSLLSIPCSKAIAESLNDLVIYLHNKLKEEAASQSYTYSSVGFQTTLLSIGCEGRSGFDYVEKKPAKMDVKAQDNDKSGLVSGFFFPEK